MTLKEQRDKLLTAIKKVKIILLDIGRASSRDTLANSINLVKETVRPIIAQIEAQIAGEAEGDPAFRKTAWDVKALLKLPANERDEILKKAAEAGAHLYVWAITATMEEV